MEKILDNLTTKLFNSFPQINLREAFHFQIFSPSDFFEKLLKSYFANKIPSSFVSLKTNTYLPEFIVNSIIENIQIIDKQCTQTSLRKFLLDEKYEKVDRAYDPGTFHTKGDTLVLVSYGTGQCFRFEFFGEDIEKIIEIDLVSLRAVKEMESVYLFPKVTFDKGNFIEFEIINPDLKFNKNFVLDIKTVGMLNKDVVDLNLATVPVYIGNQKLFSTDLGEWNKKKYEIYYVGNEVEKFHELYPYIKAHIINDTAGKGFIYDSEKIVVLTDREIFGKLELTAKVKRKNKISKLFEDQVAIGEYIVHEFHGIGVYDGIDTKMIDGEPKDFIKIKYLDEDVLFVPIDQTQRITKYVGNEGHDPKLTRLGSAEWENIKRRISKSIEDLADELLELYAKREMSKGFIYTPDQEMMNQLEASFPYEETEDQKRAILEIKEDMESEKPMDRLLVGDVGFGKTEIGVRTAFKAVLDHRQVAILAPTTILAAQLHAVFSERLKDFPVTVARVTRFDGVQKNKETLQKLSQGKVDIIVGTHRLLSNDVEFKDLGLLIIDEEQRFGVKQKEKIKKVRVNIDVLAMSATPIPRTLQMSLAGIRDISILSTPPKGRIAVSTAIIHREEIYDHIEYEVKRGGQVFFVHNSIETLDSIAAQIHEKLPDVKVTVGHGQMSGDKLEKIMYEFINGEYQVLLATTIVENGIDLPHVNTIIIDDAHKFGLSQLHQLRGRVGRGKVQAYCYLVIPKFKVSKDIEEAIEMDMIKQKGEKVMSQESVDRVKTLVANQDLGSGFRIASRDMEMRGSGNVLGSQQSGNINSVGYELYMRLLAEEIEKRRREGR